MEQEKIGKFIKKIREEKNMTQAELAEKLHISDKSVSKWERGLTLPDIANLKMVCDILDISINDLLSGEKNNKDNKSYVDGIKYYNRKIKYRYIRYMVMLFIAFLLISGLTFFMNDYNKNLVYSIESKIDDYVINGYIVINQDMSLFIVDNLFYQGPLVGVEDEPFTDKIRISLYYDKQIINTYEFKDDSKKKYNDILLNINFTSLNDNEFYKQIKDPDNFYLVIECSDGKSKFKEKIHLNIKQIFSNNKLFY